MTWLTTAQWRYCAKVGIATALGYALTLGRYNDYAIYGAFTAALVVGASVGEDLSTSLNRVKGTLVGMIVGMATSAVVPASLLSVGIAAGLTAVVALAFGWGVSVARVGVTICIVTLAVHGTDAVTYDLMRAANTLIGIVAGLAVTFFIWPVRGHDELARTTKGVLAASRTLLDGLAKGEKDLRRLQGKLLDALEAVVKAGRDAKVEWSTGKMPRFDEERLMEVIRLGVDVLAAALMPEAPQGTLQELDQRLRNCAADSSPPAAQSAP